MPEIWTTRLNDLLLAIAIPLIVSAGPFGCASGLAGGSETGGRGYCYSVAVVVRRSGESGDSSVFFWWSEGNGSKNTVVNHRTMQYEYMTYMGESLPSSGRAGGGCDRLNVNDVINPSLNPAPWLELFEIVRVPQISLMIKDRDLLDPWNPQQLESPAGIHPPFLLKYELSPRISARTRGAGGSYSLFLTVILAHPCIYKSNPHSKDSSPLHKGKESSPLALIVFRLSVSTGLGSGGWIYRYLLLLTSPTLAAKDAGLQASAIDGVTPIQLLSCTPFQVPTDFQVLPTSAKCQPIKQYHEPLLQQGSRLRHTPGENR